MRAPEPVLVRLIGWQSCLPRVYPSRLTTVLVSRPSLADDAALRPPREPITARHVSGQSGSGTAETNQSQLDFRPAKVASSLALHK